MVRRINLKSANVARSNTIRNINRQIILNYIREQGPISRAEIARITALQRSTVSLIAEELLDANLIQEILGESSGGRPPQLLSIKASKAVAIGIDLGQKKTIVATTDLSGNLLEKKEFATSKNFSKTISQVIECSRYFIDKNSGSIDGIGISVPGMVEITSGEVLIIPHMDWHRPKIVETVEEATGLPVKVDNDANVTALAELWFGRPEISNIRDFIVVCITSGIGTGIVFDGQIYRGKGGVAGEFGHMTIGSNAPIECAAGSSDCWEAFASERAAVARYQNRLRNDGSEKISFEQLVEIALKGDKNAIAALKETAHYIGIGVSNLMQGLSPEVTVIAGTIVKVWSLIEDDIKKGAEAAACQGYPPVKIMASSLGNYPVLMGAFSLILADKFASATVM